MTAEEDEAEESALTELLARQVLLKLSRPRGEVTALPDELRRNPLAILDGVPRSHYQQLTSPTPAGLLQKLERDHRSARS